MFDVGFKYIDLCSFFTEMAVNYFMFIHTLCPTLVSQKKFSVVEFKSIQFSVSKLLITDSGVGKTNKPEGLCVNIHVLHTMSSTSPSATAPSDSPGWDSFVFLCRDATPPAADFQCICREPYRFNC